jgi:hypothetical protein
METVDRKNRDPKNMRQRHNAQTQDTPVNLLLDKDNLVICVMLDKAAKDPATHTFEETGIAEKNTKIILTPRTHQTTGC